LNPLISIITPVYNVENFIKETIESVLIQTYSNWELILIDDGSTDKSSEICKKYVIKDKRIKYFYKKNGGQASARNLGIKNAKGDYITFLDSDDLYFKDKLENHLYDLKKYNADFYYGAGLMLFENRTTNKIESYDWFYGEFSGTDFFKILYHSCAVNINTVLVKRNLFNTVGLFDESSILRGTEDFDLWLRIALKVNKIYGSPKAKVYYRIHDNGIHLQKANMLIGKCKIYEKFENQSIIHSLVKKREYRYIYRELFNYLMLESREDEIKAFFYEYYEKDSYNIVALNQKLLINLFTISTFLWLSNNVLYRIGFRLEKLTYKLFLHE
jgi:teichuronic acid biosynthesis glycosyltransferase TuaG